MLLPRKYTTALKAAVEASAVIMDFYVKGYESELKHDGSPVTQADIASGSVIEELLGSTNIPITGEESVKLPFEERKDWKESWCVDPLDGTKEFLKRNGEFSVNIALIRENHPVFGVIASPTEGKLIFGGIETGVYEADFRSYQNHQDWQKVDPISRRPVPVTMTCSRSHHSGPDLQFINQLRDRFGEVDFIRKGSALKFFDLARDHAHVYPRYAPTMEWDIAAGQAILEGVGGKVVHAFKNEPLRYNKENLTNPYFLAYTRSFAALNGW